MLATTLVLQEHFADVFVTTNMRVFQPRLRCYRHHAQHPHFDITVEKPFVWAGVLGHMGTSVRVVGCPGPVARADIRSSHPDAAT